jgi:hypothetical protein
LSDFSRQDPLRFARAQEKRRTANPHDSALSEAASGSTVALRSTVASRPEGLTRGYERIRFRCFLFLRCVSVILLEPVAEALGIPTWCEFRSAGAQKTIFSQKNDDDDLARRSRPKQRAAPPPRSRSRRWLPGLCAGGCVRGMSSRTEEAAFRLDRGGRRDHDVRCDAGVLPQTPCVQRDCRRDGQCRHLIGEVNLRSRHFLRKKTIGADIHLVIDLPQSKSCCRRTRHCGPLTTHPPKHPPEIQLPHAKFCGEQDGPPC